MASPTDLAAGLEGGVVHCRIRTIWGERKKKRNSMPEAYIRSTIQSPEAPVLCDIIFKLVLPSNKIPLSTVLPSNKISL